MAVGRAALSAVVIVILLVAGGAAYYLTTLGGANHNTTSTTSSTGGTTSTTISSSSSSTTSSSTSSQATPQSITYETLQTIQFLDPQVSYDIFGASVEQNVYESLLWFNGTNGQDVVPWLAQSYSISTDQKSLTATLRSGIKFADGETLNSTDVYFSYNRLLVFDGSSPVGHGTQASWIMQQLLNTSLSTTLCSCSQTYGNSYVQAVIKENFVQITGPSTVTLHIMNPQGALPYLLSNLWANIVAPDFVMQHDIALWSTPSLGYHLPYPTLSGNVTQKMIQYFDDFQSTCDSKGCAATYLDSSQQGSLAGTGPYTIQSVDTTANVITMKANPTYWGGPAGTNKAHIPTVVVKFVPDQTTREIDLKNAAQSNGQAMVIDVANTNVYDVADRNSWLSNGKLVSTISGVSIYGPFTQYATVFIPLDTNVTNAFTGTFYKFQPFADLRFRTAVGDSVNLTVMNQNYNNNIGKVANEVIPPGIPPNGAYSASIKPTYSFNPDSVQSLLLGAMQHPLTHFNYENGTAAKAGTFDNTFGCAALNGQGRCDHPTPQSISLIYATGDIVDQQILTQIASTMNNVSVTYNMGLTVQVTPLPSGQMTSEAFAGQVYAWAEAPFGWYDDYPWSMDFLGPILSPGGIYTAPGGWNLKQMGDLWAQAQAANAKGDSAGVAAASNAMATLGNKMVMDIWTFYPEAYIVMTSNVHGFYFNPAIYTTGEPPYFAALY
jgi:ABC-type transport system substrate-binding protein